jgi:hypothetical protein
MRPPLSDPLSICLVQGKSHVYHFAWSVSPQSFCALTALHT